ncbi:MAG: YcxB family protein [Cyanobacteriota bacterium]|nr:YcxB family protein [Cyanobacteriota bacterium]
MKIEYRLSLSDYKETNKFHSKSQKFQYLMLWLLSIVSIFYGVLYTIYIFNIYQIVFWILLALLVNPEINLVQRLSMNYAWKNQSGAFREPMEVEILEEGISRTTPNSQSFTRWPIFTKFIETQNLFILYQGKRSIDIVPKRAFESEEQIREFKIILDENISQSS